MVTWCCVTQERRDKCKLVMDAFAHCWPGAKILEGSHPPDDGSMIVVWGQIWLIEQILPRAIEAGRPFWQIDNGFFDPVRGRNEGYYRFSYRSLSPILLKDAGLRILIPMKPWRTEGKHIVLALPSDFFGCSIGLNMIKWKETIQDQVKKFTDRPIIVREKNCTRPLADDLKDAWALVTHSSNAAVDAVFAGIPAFVESTCPTAPLGNLSLANIEQPEMVNRDAWLASLTCQQFSLDELYKGIAYPHLKQIQEQVDGYS